MNPITRVIPALCFSFFLSTASAQPYKNIVFEGAGIRGIAYAGALKALEEKNILQQVEKVGGTSAGAIAALTVALGYNSLEIEQIIYNTKVQKFNDGAFFFIGGLSRLNRKYGWYRGKAFTKWLEKIIVAKTGNANITFRELKAANFKSLYVTGTSLNHQKLIIFSEESYPDMKIKDAVRISMSIPLYFEAVIIDSAGNVLNRREATGNFDVMVDGGFTGNFPIHIFDKVSTSDGVTRIPDTFTIGFRIDSPEQIAYDVEKKGLAPIPVYQLKNYVSAFYNYVIENLNRGTLTEEDWLRTISVSSGSIGPKVRKLSQQEKSILVTNGFDATKAFLSQFN